MKHQTINIRNRIALDITYLSPFPTYTNFHTVDHDFGIFKNRSGVGTKFVVDRSNSWCALMDRDDT